MAIEAPTDNSLATRANNPPAGLMQGSSVSPNSAQQEWDTKYRSGPTPWDTRITPPEVKSFWASGRISLKNKPSSERDAATVRCALDLGCGPGTNAAYLAGLGLRVVGVEVSGVALTTARSRHIHAMASGRLAFIQADVARLPFCRAHADYILDIGCLHGLSLELRNAYARNVIAALRPGGYYHLYAFDRQPEQNDTRGLASGELEVLFTSELKVIEAIEARPDMRPCHWYLLQKPASNPNN
jgi:SAM-dependent methyltransferase